jgi:transcriptional regulator GlxA family with amidase domain
MLLRRLAVLAAASIAIAAPAVSPLHPPADRPIRVAVVVTEGSTLIDFAGPWEVFQDVQMPGGGFELYTVSDDTRPRTISAGMKLVPRFSYTDAPAPDVVVVGAQLGSAAMQEWLLEQAPRVQVLMSVCTGAAKLAAAGLLDGKKAATHHDFAERLGRRFPQVEFVRGQRFIQSDPVIITAGGLTSGIDAALHVVERYYGRDTAQRTADYMEYSGDGWKTHASH